MNSYTTADWLTAVKRGGHLPPNQVPFQDTDLLAIADEQLQTGILALLRAVRENYYLTYVDLPLSVDSTYDIPVRAIGATLNDVQLVEGETLFPVVRSEIHDQFSTVASPTGSYCFYILGNKVVIRPLPQTGQVRLWYQLRPNQLISTANAAQITGIAGNILTITGLPSTISTATPIDIIDDQPHFNTLVMDSVPTNTTPTTITLSSVPSTVAVGDWVAPGGQTPVPQIPVEFRPLLTQRVAVKYCELQGYLDKMKVAQNKLMELEKQLLELINPRVMEAPKKIPSNWNILGGYRRWRAWRAT